jgi:hypothetical protein
MCKTDSSCFNSDSSFSTPMQSKLKDPSDWEEYEVLARLVRVNEAQHRRADYFSCLQSVVRCASLHSRLAAAKHARTLAEISGCSTESKDVGVPHIICFHSVGRYHRHGFTLTMD